MGRKGHYLGQKDGGFQLQCPLDLDSIILSDSFSPEFLETNLNVSHDIMWDAIKNSTCSGCLLWLDVIKGFSKDFRYELYKCMDAFNKMSRNYFRIKLENCGDETLKNQYVEVHATHDDMVFNPLNMLGNNRKEQEMKVLRGEMTLRQFLLERIHVFLDGGSKDDVDFSKSLFLPDILNPRWFKELSEAEQLVVVGNLDRYFKFSKSFSQKRSFGEVISKMELNHPQNLIRHILLGDVGSTRRVKLQAWRQLIKEIENMGSRYTSMDMSFPSAHCYALFSYEDMKAITEPKIKAMEKMGYSPEDFMGWIEKADGTFESFELDCTLHNLDASDFLLLLLTDWNWSKMTNALMDFQDDATKDKLLFQVGSVMKSFR